MSVFTLLRRESASGSPQQATSSDTLSAPGSLIVATAGLSGNGEVLRAGGDVEIDGLLRGPFNGTGLTIGKAGSSSGTGSAMTIASFTTTQQGYLTAAAGMKLFSSSLGWFQSYNGTRWGDEAANNNFQATANPTTSNDSTQGYTNGSLWLNTASTPQTLWECLSNAASAAVWTLVTVLDTAGYLQANLNTPNPNNPAVYCLENTSLYSAPGSLQAANQVDFMRVWLPAGRVITKMQTFIESGANGSRQLQFGIYNQATATSITGTPNSLVASTAAGTPASGVNGTFYSVSLSSSYTIPTSGFYWLAMQVSDPTFTFTVSETFESAYLFRYEETAGGFTLPSSPSGLTQPQSAVVYVAAVE